MEERDERSEAAAGVAVPASPSPVSSLLEPVAAAAHFGRASVTAYLKHALDLQFKFAEIADTLTAHGQKAIAWTNGANSFRQLASVSMPAHEMVRFFSDGSYSHILHKKSCGCNY